VEKAIAQLQNANMLDLERIHALDHETLAGLIRPSGYFNIKARRLQNLCRWLLEQGGMTALEQQPTYPLRTGLLSVNGIGPETADDIVLYAFNRPVFVIDAYTRRLLGKLGLAQGNESYEALRAGFEANLPPDPALFNEYHALIVRHAKQKCQLSPDCVHCQIEAPIR
jgi:endonuclease-3 related protein